MSIRPDDVLAEDTGLDEIDGAFEIEGEWHLRSAMIRLQQLEHDASVTKRRFEMIASSYKRDLERLAEQERELRASIHAYLVNHGGEKVRFPDVGTAYLAAADPKIEIVDTDAFKAATEAAFTKPVFDEAAAKRYALEQALESGEIIPGTELKPAGKRLQIRKA